MRANEFLTEYRNRMYQYIKSIVPAWPDYVVRDWLYANIARGETQGSNWSFRNAGTEIPRIVKAQQLSLDTKWQLIPNMKFTMDMWIPEVVAKLATRAGGKANPDQVPRDAERHATQSQLAQQQGGVRKEPVILVKRHDGYDLLEGWHRTIQHFHKFPNGYTGPAYVAVEQGEPGVTQGSLKEFAPGGQDASDSGRWYTDDQLADIIGDDWFEDFDVSNDGFNIDAHGEKAKQNLVDYANTWFDDRGYNVNVLGVEHNEVDHNLKWYIVGSFHNPGFANKGVAEGFLNESAYEEAWELISQPVPEIQQFVKQLGLAQDDTTAKQIAPMIDATPDTQLPAASIPKLKNLANKGNDVQTLKAIQQISGRPDAAQQYAKIMQARDAGEGRQRGYDVSGLINSVKSGNYEAPVLLKLATGTYVIGGRTRLYAALALGIPAKVKIISVSTFAKQDQQGVAEGKLG
jgi:hypothetical protein